ncbi:MAG: 50S ribosomal protein L23 [Bradymonadaceae bacterium]|nr:50S ribosomal protein L23 [Lujinxingiaceae bacterium]
MTNPYDIIIRPVLTEKTTEMAEDNKVVFRVNKKANKHQIREAVEKLFGVDVVKVNTIFVPSKPKRVGRSQGRRSPYKKAVITMAQGQTIDFYASETPEGEAGVL